MYIHTYVCMYIYIYIYIYVYICTYIHTYIHTYTIIYVITYIRVCHNTHHAPVSAKIRLLRKSITRSLQPTSISERYNYKPDPNPDPINRNIGASEHISV